MNELVEWIMSIPEGQETISLLLVGVRMCVLSLALCALMSIFYIIKSMGQSAR